MNESRMIRQARQGDVPAFNQLVLAYQDRLYSAAYRIMGDPASAADATQEAFITAYHKLGTFRDGSFKSWLLRIVTNACYDELRRRKRRPAESIEDLTPDDSADPPPQLVSLDGTPEDHTERAELSAGIERCIRGLSAEHRTLVVLRDIEDLDYQEIAAATGLELGTVKSRLSRARARLRDCLRGLGELLPTEYRLTSNPTSAEKP
jgi:RNA polymerase sigma factor (sigma-70 family)